VTPREAKVTKIRHGGPFWPEPVITQVTQLVTVRVREVRVCALGERLRFGLPKIQTVGGQMSVRPPLQAASDCGCEALRRTRLRSCFRCADQG
jgi:hypothetical protein